MKFDYVIGNPPYQKDTKDTSSSPIYNFFMDEAFKISNVVEVITPAKFLFNAGKTPTKWNNKILSDKHFKVLLYESNAQKIFPNTSFEGGIAVTYRDNSKIIGPIGTFTDSEKLNGIIKKVVSNNKNFKSILPLFQSSDIYKLTKKFHDDYPDAKMKLSKGHENTLTSNIFEKIPNAFHNAKKSNDDIKLYGRLNNKRCIKFVSKIYLKEIPNLLGYKIILPKSNGSRPVTEEGGSAVIGSPELIEPNEGYTQTFISIGPFETELCAKAVYKYIKSKFCRVMIGTKKITQHNASKVWVNVPLQDFTDHSDIDWSKSIPEIDQQLYRKYGLNDEEIDFIETHVKEMA